MEVTKLPPASDTPNDKFPEAKKFIDKGFHRLMYRFSPNDYKQLSEIWNGSQVDTGEPREVVDGPPEGGEVPDLTPMPALYAPGVNEEDIAEIAQRLGS